MLRFLGMVIRDSNCAFVAGRSLVIAGCVDVDIGEAMGFLEALSWVKHLGLHNVIVEGDSKSSVDAIVGSSSSISSFGDIINHCHSLLSILNNVSVLFVKRNANYMTHAFVRASRLFGSPSCWVEPPDFVDGLRIGACSCG